MRILVAFLCIGVFYVIQKVLYERFWDYNLSVTLAFEDSLVSEGQSTYLIETVENNKFLPIPLLRVKFATPKYFLFGKEKNTMVTDQYYRHNVYSIVPYQRIIRKYPFECSKRGCYTLTRVDLVSRDLFLSTILANQCSLDCCIYVLPKKYQKQELSIEIMASIGTMINQAALNEDPFELKGIRDYQPYDNVRFVNWKQTAKTRKLQVNTHFPTTTKNISIYLNLDVNAVAHAESIQEECIRLAYTFASLLLASGVSVRFLTNGRDLFTDQTYVQEAGSGSHYLHQLGHALARIDTAKTVANLTPQLLDLNKKALTNHQLILISNYRKPDICQALSSLRENGIVCQHIIPEFKDIEIPEATSSNTLVWEVDYDKET